MLARVRLAAALSAASLLLSTQAFAFQAPSSSAPPKAADEAYMKERVCETVTVTGSRLGKKKFCATRAEWADQKLQDRQVIEKIQMSPCVPTTSGATGRPSC